MPAAPEARDVNSNPRQHQLELQRSDITILKFHRFSDQVCRSSGADRNSFAFSINMPLLCSGIFIEKARCLFDDAGLYS
jgi:hypothetical protein